MDIAVYLFTGFLESGKSTFMNETMQDNRFAGGDKTLILLCEEGEIELDTKSLEEKNIFVEVIEDESEVTETNFKKLQKKH